ncbi:DUF1120 domain-containing protein [Trinickia violacea]|nr:DUF1120 domain-containing protein [Trinickia violacea]
MKFPLLCTLLATIGGMSFTQAHAQSVEVKVIGTIKPAACTPTLAGGGVVDYGDIKASTLKQTEFNVLSEKNLALSITCDSPMKIGLRVTDNRPETVVPGAQAASGGGGDDSRSHGLGAVSGKNVGIYTMSVREFTGDSTSVDTVRSTDAGKTWMAGAWMLPGGTHMTSWAATDNKTVPGAYKNLTGTVTVATVLNKGSELPLENDVRLDGSATLELVYL